MSGLAKALIAAALLTTLAACNTVRGVGRDVQAVGSTVEDVAE